VGITPLEQPEDTQGHQDGAKKEGKHGTALVEQIHGNSSRRPLAVVYRRSAMGLIGIGPVRLLLQSVKSSLFCGTTRQRKDHDRKWACSSAAPTSFWSSRG
jgi:hypothetical protein